METRNLTCIGCPKGCSLIVELENTTVLSVKGNSCKVGEQYGKNECTNPSRILTTIIPINNGDINMLPCKTSKPIKKTLIFDALKEISKVTVTAPIHIGTVIIENILNTNSNIIATREVLEK